MMTYCQAKALWCLLLPRFKCQHLSPVFSSGSWFWVVSVLSCWGVRNLWDADSWLNEMRRKEQVTLWGDLPHVHGLDPIWQLVHTALLQGSQHDDGGFSGSRGVLLRGDSSFTSHLDCCQHTQEVFTRGYKRGAKGLIPASDITVQHHFLKMNPEKCFIVAVIFQMFHLYQWWQASGWNSGDSKPPPRLKVSQIHRLRFLKGGNCLNLQTFKGSLYFHIFKNSRPNFRQKYSSDVNI